MLRAGEYQLWAYVMDDCDGARDSGCDSEDEFVPVGDLEALRLQLASDNRDEDMESSDSVSEGESGIVSSSDECTRGSSPEGISGGAGSDEGELSDESLCSSTEEPISNEKVRYGILAFSTDGDDSAKEIPADSSCQYPEKQTSADSQERTFLLFVAKERTAAHGEQWCSTHMSNVGVPREMPAFFLLEVTQLPGGRADE